MKRLCGIWATVVVGVPVESDIHPLRALSDIEDRYGRAKARQGLKMAINDIVADGEGLSDAQVTELDAKLAAQEAMTLSEARARFSKKLRSVIRSGRLQNDTEYYMVRNAVELMDQKNKAECRALHRAYEATMDQDG